MERLLRRDPEWVGMIEAAHSPAADDAAWAARVLEACRRLFSETAFINIVGVVLPEPGAAIDVPFSAGYQYRGAAETQLRAFDAISRSALLTLFFPPTLVNSHRHLERRLPADARALLQQLRRETGISDALGLVLQPALGESVVISTGIPHASAPTRHERRRLTQLALHLEAGLRARRRPQEVKAVVESNGRVVHLEPGAPSRENLRHSVRMTERARTRRHRRAAESLDLWTALIDGHASLVERSEGGRRRYLVVGNPPLRRPMRSLGSAERDVVSAAARGLSAKLIAYSLGISNPTVSSRLESAATKLGLSSRTELVRLAARLSVPERATAELAGLTRVQREVLDLIADGLTNAEIAARRGRSIHTIANQVTGLLARTGAPTRRALATRS